MCRPPSSTSGRAVYKEGKTRISIIIAEIVIGRTRTPSPRYPDANGDHCLGPSAGQAEAFLGVIDHHAVLCGDGKHHAVGQVNGQCGLLGMDVHQLKNDGAKPDCHHRLQGRNSASVAPEQALSALGMTACCLQASVLRLLGKGPASCCCRLQAHLDRWQLKQRGVPTASCKHKRHVVLLGSGLWLAEPGRHDQH